VWKALNAAGDTCLASTEIKARAAAECGDLRAVRLDGVVTCPNGIKSAKLLCCPTVGESHD
jgi:hypothetical protein